MALEEAIVALTKGVAELTALMKSGKPTVAATPAAAAATPAAAAAKPAGTVGRPPKPKVPTSKFDVNAVHGAAVACKAAIGQDETRALIAATGAADLNDLKAHPELWDAFMASVEDAMKPDDGSTEAGEDPNDGL
jgi:hypothetical protein